MNTRSTYKTRQRQTLLNYLETVPGTHITALDVCDYFRRQGTPIAQATIYRQLERLVEEGVLNKYTIDSSSPACFEYIGHVCHEEAGICFHCKCEKCGKLIHLHCDELEEIGEYMLKEHNFKLDPFRTVFYGLCEDCAGKEVS